jgi:hypothetical protein
MDDGSIEVDFGDASLSLDLGAGSHDENIAEIIDEGDLEELASDLVGAFISQTVAHVKSGRCPILKV